VRLTRLGTSSREADRAASNVVLNNERQPDVPASLASLLGLELSDPGQDGPATPGADLVDADGFELDGSQTGQALDDL
jgi:hypothetical protein